MPVNQITDRYLIPNDNTFMRRYLNQYKALDFLKTTELHFSRVMQFPKINEVLLSIEEKMEIREEYRSQGKADWEQWAQDKINHLESSKNYTYINCWNSDRGEIRSLWNEYVNEDNGICFKTSYKKICEGLNKSKYDIQIPKIRYFYGIEKIFSGLNYVALYSRKLRDFTSENEVRLIIQLHKDTNPFPPFLKIEIDFNSLCEGIILSPNRTDSFKQEVVLLLDKLNYHGHITESILGPNKT